MNWLSKVLPPKINTENDNKVKSNIPEGLWKKCDNCNEILYYTELINNLYVCPKCDHHHIMNCRDRISIMLDTESFLEIGKDLQAVDVLQFKDSKKYSDRILEAKERVNENDALVVMNGKMNNINVILAVFEFRFIGGSMGSVVGEKFYRGVKFAYDNNYPFICITSSGGARMQEGLTSLMQMAKTCAAISLLNEKKIPFISILTDPTMGGVSASFAFLGDVVISEPDALIGFAGKRVIEQTVKQKLPENFQRAEFLLEKGAIDMVVRRNELKQVVVNLISLLLNYKITS